ncbi:MAG TPA: hypothetical protein VKM37_08295 [Balneolaceae bacterium]|nr:hypothetical protein [Balneolaceae bacterium]
MDKKYKYFFVILALTSMLSFMNLHLERDASDGYDIKTEITFAGVEASQTCDFNCLTGLDETSGPDGTQKWICGSSGTSCSSCSLKWVEHGPFGTGSCNNSNIQISD